MSRIKSVLIYAALMVAIGYIFIPIVWDLDWTRGKVSQMICLQVARSEGASTETRIYPDRFYPGGFVFGEVGMCSKGPYVHTIKVYPRTNRPITLDGVPVADAVSVSIKIWEYPERGTEEGGG